MDEIDSEEEAFQKFIVTSDVESSDNEKNKENSPEEKLYTKTEQFEMMAAFTSGNNIDDLGKDLYTKRWETFTKELNQIGPPKRSSQQWRKIWSGHKYDRKRKLAELSEPNTSKRFARETKVRGSVANETISATVGGISSAPTISLQRKSITKGKSSSEESPQNINKPVELSFGGYEQMVLQLRLLTGKQNEVIQNQVAIMKKLDKSNEFLERIAKKP